MINDRPGCLLVLLVTIRDLLRYVRTVALDVRDAVEWNRRHCTPTRLRRRRQIRADLELWATTPIEPGDWINEAW
jgi:hypothetical protein